MSGKNGFNVVEALKEDLRTRSIPVVVIAAQISAEERTRLNGHVQKIAQKAEFDHGRLPGELKRTLTGKGI